MDHHQPEPVTLSWENINVFVRGKKKAEKPVQFDAESGSVNTVSKKGNGNKQILNQVTGVVQPGTLLAVMGASGAGKSTLMNVLTSRNLKDYKVEGEVKINGVVVDGGIRNVSAYVQQDDLFFNTLTVRETLTVRALLRMDNRISKAARLQRVEEVIQEMGLTKCAKTQIAAGAKKGISGGEAKRLSFACEMLTNPPLMFCDEPTSGLDTFMAQNIVQTLQDMAQKNRTILCTIHQPSSEIFAMFDKVLLMAEGRVAFLGSSTRAMEFFRTQGFVCPTNFNPSDFYVLTLAIVPGKEDECRKKVHSICDSFKETEDAREIKKGIDQVSGIRNQNQELIEEAFSSESRYEASWFQQFKTILWRSAVSLKRDVFLFRVRMIQTLVMAIMLGLIYLQTDTDQRGVMNINGVLFLLVTNASFTNLFSVINSFPNEIGIFMREYGSGLYRTDVYFLAKSLAELPTFLLLPFIFITVDYWMIGLYDDWRNYLIAAGVVILVSNIAVSFGLLISSLTADVNIALAVAPPIMIPFLMFGGFFLNDESVPVYFIWLKYLSWFKYSMEYLCVNQWEDVDFIECADATNATCLYRNGDQVLKYLSFSKDNNDLNLGMMFVLLCGFRILAFIILLIRARRSRT